MLKREYYCLVAGLPDLIFNEIIPGLSSTIFRNELKSQLTPSDFQLVEILFYPFDNRNLITLMFGQDNSFNNLGIYSKDFLEKQIENPTLIREYMKLYLNWFNALPAREYSVQKENKLHHLFHTHILQIKNEFLVDWFNFNLNVKNILTAIRCKKHGYNIKNQLLETEMNSEICTLLLSHHYKHSKFDEIIPYAEQIFRIGESESGMLEKERLLDKIRWEYLDDATFFNYFTIERILSFVYKLIITERWLKMDIDTGKELLNKLINELKTSYDFPAEYSLLK